MVQPSTEQFWLIRSSDMEMSALRAGLRGVSRDRLYHQEGRSLEVIFPIYSLWQHEQFAANSHPDSEKIHTSLPNLEN